LDNQLFGIVILMTLITTLISPPLLNAFLQTPGIGTRKPVKGDDSASAVWNFNSSEIAGLVTDTLLKDLRAEGFYVQMMNIDEGLSQARRNDITLSITRGESDVTIVTAKDDMPFVKTVVYEVILALNETIQKLKDSSDPKAMKKELANLDGRKDSEILSLIRPDCIILNLKGDTKEAVITELVDLLDMRGKLENRDLTLADVLQREKTMSTGMQHGVALPHGKTDGVKDIVVAVGIKKEGVDFESLDGEKSRLIILVASPRKTSGPHVQFLAAVGGVLKEEDVREEIIAADSRELAATLLRRGQGDYYTP
jgi:fructose-specific phosphotransferase system IIA component